MATSKAIEKAKSVLEARREELRSELTQIDRALADLNGGRRGPGRPRGSKNSTTGTKRRRRRRGGTRAEHALRHIDKNPGASASEIAKGMGIKPNYVYRVMGELEKEGKVNKKGKGYYPVTATG